MMRASNLPRVRCSDGLYPKGPFTLRPDPEVGLALNDLICGCRKRAGAPGAVALPCRPQRFVSRSKGLARKQLDEFRQQVWRLGDAACARSRQDGFGLLGPEVAGVFVDLDTGSQAVQVEFGVELCGVYARADPESLHRAVRRGGQ